MENNTVVINDAWTPPFYAAQRAGAVFVRAALPEGATTGTNPWSGGVPGGDDLERMVLTDGPLYNHDVSFTFRDTNQQYHTYGVSISVVGLYSMTPDIGFTGYPSTTAYLWPDYGSVVCVLEYQPLDYNWRYMYDIPTRLVRWEGPADITGDQVACMFSYPPTPGTTVTVAAFCGDTMVSRNFKVLRYPSLVVDNAKRGAKYRQNYYAKIGDPDVTVRLDVPNEPEVNWGSQIGWTLQGGMQRIDAVTCKMSCTHAGTGSVGIAPCASVSSGEANVTVLAVTGVVLPDGLLGVVRKDAEGNDITVICAPVGKKDLKLKAHTYPNDVSEDDLPDDIVTWSPEAAPPPATSPGESNRKLTYTISPNAAPDVYTISATCGTGNTPPPATLAIVGVDYQVQGSNDIAAWPEAPSGGWSDCLTFSIDLVAATEPPGFEELLRLRVSKVTPTGAGTGHVLRMTSDTSSKSWRYVTNGANPLIERVSDLHPGGLEQRWKVTIRDDFTEKEKTLKVCPVFAFLVDKKRRYDDALDYVWQKYNGAGLQWVRGSYDPKEKTRLGVTKRETQFGFVWTDTGWVILEKKTISYGGMAYQNENVLASVICHETMHYGQSSDLAARACKAEQVLKRVEEGTPGWKPPAIPNLPLQHTGAFSAYTEAELPPYVFEIACSATTGIAPYGPGTDSYYNATCEMIAYLRWLSQY